jgi:aryl-alcohol dehydrogenase-like predicted oxidoreductase
MQYTHLGRTGLVVSRLVLGTMNFGPETSEDDSFAIMDRALEHGINFFDTANVYGWRKGEGYTEQSLYNLLSRNIELEVLPACEAYGLGVIPWSPLGGGLLAGALTRTEKGRRSQARIQEGVEQNRAKLEAYERLCSELGEDPAHVALAWLLTNPVVTGPIVGPRTKEQLDGTLRALDIDLSKETLEKLDKIFPGPGGPAPEAYAW